MPGGITLVGQSARGNAMSKVGWIFIVLVCNFACIAMVVAMVIWVVACVLSASVAVTESITVGIRAAGEGVHFVFRCIFALLSWFVWYFFPIR